MRDGAGLVGFSWSVRASQRGSRISAGRRRHTAVSWLHHQPQYLVPFGEIQLLIQPPPCYRGGSAAFLERVAGRGEPEQISLLEEPPERLARAFRLDPWVEKVVRVAYGPGRISVALEYREPAAWVKLPAGQQQVIDGQGRILPADDLEIEPLGRMIKITGVELAAPADPRPGLLWKAKDPKGGMDEVDARVVAAARLAAFLKAPGREREAEAAPALRIIEIIVSNMSDFSRRGLFVMNAEGAEKSAGGRPRARRAQVNRRPGKSGGCSKRGASSDRLSIARAGGLLAVFQKRSRQKMPASPVAAHAPFKRLRARSNRLPSRADPAETTGAGKQPRSCPIMVWTEDSARAACVPDVEDRT